MAVPKKRQSRTRRDSRRAENMKLESPSLSLCPQCKKPKLPHRVCIHCGFYKGREVFQLSDK